MSGSKVLFLASWVILIAVSVFTAIGALASLQIAYVGHNDDLSPTVTIESIRSIGGDEAVKNYKGRRATAATWAVGYAVLAAVIAFIPYRRGERWAWWALFAAIIVSQLLSLGRVLMLGATLGVGTAGSLLAFFLLGLLAGVPRMFFEAQSDGRRS
jgi:hypothetical protein